MKIFLILVAFILGPNSASAVSADQLRLTLENVRAAFDLNYAFFDWKKENRQWDVDHRLARIRARIDAGDYTDPFMFRRDLYGLLESAHDHHMELAIESTERAELPFTIRSADGGNGQRRYFIVHVESSQDLDPRVQVGREVVTFNSRPIDEEVAHLVDWNGRRNKMAAQRLAELRLTVRQGYRGMPIPKGTFTLGLREADGSVTNVPIQWRYFEEKLKPSPTVRSGFSPWNLNAKFSYVPQLGDIELMAPWDDTFFAYTFRVEGRLYGYIRIGTFNVSNPFRAVEDFKRWMALFQSSCEAIVIDIASNTGGQVPYMYALLSLLTDQPMQPLLYQQKLSLEVIRRANLILDLAALVTDDESARRFFGGYAPGYPVDREFVNAKVEESQHLIDSWNRGEKISPPFFGIGVRTITPYPNAVHYTKPILLITDSLSWSASDSFAAVLKDNHRARLFGTPTAGAGGLIRDISFPNALGIHHIQLPDGIVLRADGRMIEEFGIAPDDYYDLQVPDFTDGFSSLRDQILRSLQTAIRTSPGHTDH